MSIAAEEVKRESIRLAYSLLFLGIALAVLWFSYPKLMARSGKHQADAYWKAEREANERRLFGGDDE